MVLGNDNLTHINPDADGVTALGSSSYRYASTTAKTFNVSADSAASATLSFVADLGAQDDDTWRVEAEDSGDLKIASFATGSFVDVLSVHNNGNVTVAGDLNVNSDRRLKEDIATIENALQIVARIEGKTYNWKPELGRDRGKQYGFIAQEVEQVIPELVSTQQGDGIKSVNYQGMVPFLVNALKELNELKESQAAEIEALRNRAQGQTEKISQLNELLRRQQRLIDELIPVQASL